LRIERHLPGARNSVVFWKKEEGQEQQSSLNVWSHDRRFSCEITDGIFISSRESGMQ
jgi:hypothetical protein